MPTFSTPSIPAIPAIPPAANPPTMANPGVSAAGAANRSRATAMAGAGFDSTITNQGGSAGLLTPPSTAQRSLLG